MHQEMQNRKVLFTHFFSQLVGKQLQNYFETVKKSFLNIYLTDIEWNTKLRKYVNTKMRLPTYVMCDIILTSCDTLT